MKRVRAKEEKKSSLFLDAYRQLHIKIKTSVRNLEDYDFRTEVVSCRQKALLWFEYTILKAESKTDIAPFFLGGGVLLKSTIRKRKKKKTHQRKNFRVHAF